MATKTTVATPDPSTITLDAAVEALRRAQAELHDANGALSAIKDKTEGRIERSTSYLADGPLNRHLHPTPLPPNPTYGFDPDEVLEAKLNQPSAELRFQKAALQLRRATRVHEMALQSAQRQALDRARPALVAEFAAIVDALTPLVERYHAFVERGTALMSEAPCAEGLVRQMELCALAIAEIELADRQHWLATERASTNGGS